MFGENNLDVIDNEELNTCYGEEDELERIRNRKLKQRKLKLVRNKKRRVRSKCVGLIHVSDLNDNGPCKESASQSRGPTTRSRSCMDGVDKDKGNGVNDEEIKECLWQGCNASRRELLGLDDAFISGPFPDQVLTTMSIDANNGMYLVAYGIVEAECKTHDRSSKAAMKELKEVYHSSHSWLSQISPEHWSRALFSGRAQMC
ncbi:hypothetical protein Tco_1452965, partial [Tanacetum coccineum]